MYNKSAKKQFKHEQKPVIIQWNATHSQNFGPCVPQLCP